MQDLRIGFIGAGNMAEALCRGVLAAGLAPPQRVAAFDPEEERRALFADDLGVKVASGNDEVIAGADVIVLAIKPQALDDVLPPVGALIGGDKLVITILAGVRTSRIEDICAEGARVVRAMPNTPMIAGAGMAALCRGANASEEDLETALEIFRAAAKVVTVEEDRMDAVTAVSGSGPAYFFYLVEAMTEAGVAEGLNPETAALLASETLLGSGRLLAQAADDAAALRAKVTSPGGTTQAAIECLERDGVKDSLVAAVRRAAERSRELSG